MSKFHLHSDKYLDAIYDKRLNLVEFYWKPATIDMTEAEYRMIVTDVVDEVIDNVQSGFWKVPNWLLDNRNFLFIISPKLQEWQAKKIFRPLVRIGCKKSALVMSEDVVSQFSIEQTVQEHDQANLVMHYFFDLHQANVWLQERL